MSVNRVLESFMMMMNAFGTEVTERWGNWLSNNTLNENTKFENLDFTSLDMCPEKAFRIVNWDIFSVEEREKITKMLQRVKLSVDVVNGTAFVEQFSVPSPAQADVANADQADVANADQADVANTDQADVANDDQADDEYDEQEDDEYDEQEDDEYDEQEDDEYDDQEAADQEAADQEADACGIDAAEVALERIDQQIARNHKVVTVLSAVIVGYGMRSKITAENTGHFVQSVWVPHDVDTTLAFALNRSVWQSEEWNSYCWWANSDRRNPFAEAQLILNRNGIYMLGDGNRWNSNTGANECSLRFSPFVEKHRASALAPVQQAPAPTPAPVPVRPVETQQPATSRPVQSRRPAPVPVRHAETRQPAPVPVRHAETRRPAQQPAWVPQVYHTGFPMQQYASPYQMGYHMPAPSYYTGYHAYSSPQQNVVWSYAPAQ
jgi:hypothetical protein